MMVRIVFACFLIFQVLSTYSLAEPLINEDIRIVVGSTSTGGDTYQSATIVAKELEKKLGVKITVDAAGVTKSFATIDKTGADGKTLMFFHDSAYLPYLYGVKGLKDIFTNYRIGPLVAINPGNAYLVPKSTPYSSIHDVIEACGRGTKVRVAIQPGGTSEIGYTALKHAIKAKYPGQEDNLVRVVSGSQKEKDKALFAGEADMINGSIQASEKYATLPVYDRKAMRFVWLTSRAKIMEKANPEGYGKITRKELLQSVEPYTWIPYDKKSNFTFDKEFFFIYNNAISDEIVAYLDNALMEIYSEGKIQEEQKKSFFIPNYMPSKKAAGYLKDKRDYMASIIKGLQ